MKKKFAVEVDVTMSCRVYVDADNEEEAKEIACDYVPDDPQHYLRNGCYVSCNVTDIEEYED